MEEILQQLADEYGAPASLFERSAAARAKASGSTTDAVLRAWAVGDAAETATPEPSSSSPSGGGAAAGGGGGSERSSGERAGHALEGDGLLAAVAEARGMPASLIERSAKARASATGGSFEDVLNEWAAEEGLASKTTPAPTPAPSSSPPSGGGAAAGGGGGTVLEGAALLAAVSEARGLPESLIERSASARAKTAGVSLDDVLREWAEEEGLDVGEAPTQTAVPPEPPAPSPSSSPSGGGAGLLAAVAEARGMPESLVERSAKARAKQTDGTVEDVLNEWAKEAGLTTEAAAPEPSSPSSPSGGGAAAGGGGGTERSSDAGGQEEPAATAAGASQPTPPVTPVAAPAPAPAPAPEVVEEPQVEPSPRSRYPAWLAAAMLVIPLLAVVYLLVVPNQPSCGSAGQLAIDPSTGSAVGCDGAEYGATDVSNFAIGAEIYGTSCAVCHGADGGGGAGPAMAGGAVAETFPEGMCSTQIEWVTLGSTGWPDGTYGANGKPVGGGMPGFGGQLTDEEIAQVSLYERVQFGGLEVDAAESDCGLVTAESGG